MVTIAVQAAVLVLVAIPFGLNPSWAGVAASIVLICVLAIGISAASYAMGLILKDEDAFARSSKACHCRCCCSRASCCP